MFYLMPNGKYRTTKGLAKGDLLEVAREGMVHSLHDQLLFPGASAGPLKDWEEFRAASQPLPKPGDRRQAALYTWGNPIPVHPEYGSEFSLEEALARQQAMYSDYLKKNAFAGSVTDDHSQSSKLLLFMAGAVVLLVLLLCASVLPEILSRDMTFS